MSNTSARSGGRNQRNNPYVLDELFVSFHRSPAGTAWRWRTELTTLTMTLAALWRLALLITLTWAAVTLAGLVLVLVACRTRAGSSPGGSGASWPATASSGCATKPACTPAPGGCR